MCDGWGEARRELGANPIKGLERGAFSLGGDGGDCREGRRKGACACVCECERARRVGELEVHPTRRLFSLAVIAVIS